MGNEWPHSRVPKSKQIDLSLQDKRYTLKGNNRYTASPCRNKKTCLGDTFGAEPLCLLVRLPVVATLSVKIPGFDKFVSLFA